MLTDKERMELMNLRKRVQAQREEIKRLRKAANGVTVRGMTMPKSCTECRFAVDGWCYAAEKQGVREYLKKDERPEWCPL